jgi:asparagine synthase (glutamine-hydrolysing)
MCGIAGIFNRFGAGVDRSILTRMAQSLRHRGPDGDGFWIEGAIGLAHQRLAIRDLSAAGRQPMCDAENRVFVTFNGEIYNDQELKAELERDFGFRFRTTCDTEVLPYAYLAWGDAMFSRLEGMFAIGLWDRAAGRLVLARDAIGIKPLYCVEVNNSVLFASEVKGLLASGALTLCLDPAALHTFFAAGHVGNRSSLVTGVQQVPPGSIISFTKRTKREFQFWRPMRTGQIDDLDDAIDEFTLRLDQVVTSQLVADVPISILQSGGIDSSLISMTVARNGGDPTLYTAGFSEFSHDETALASQVAEASGLKHKVISVDRGQDLENAFVSTVHHFDGQSADTGALGFYQIAAAVRRYSKVVLSGDGGDEFFGGYETYAATRVAEFCRPILPPLLAGMVGKWAYRAGRGTEARLPASAILARFFLGLAEGAARPHLHWRRLVPAFLARQLYGPGMGDLATTNPYTEYASYYDSAHGGVVDKAMSADQRFHLQSVLAKVDAMSMAHGLEVRVPLLDRRIMEFAGQLSIRLLNPPFGPTKRVLRKAAERLGVPVAVTRARKRGFNVPIGRLLRTELRSLGDRYLDREAAVMEPFLNPDAVRNLWRGHQEKRADYAFVLWPILTFCTWRSGLGRTTGVTRASEQETATI